jgi:osmotically-inducible protein OsmY|nr:transport-associated protein [Aeromicrobium sp.]
MTATASDRHDHLIQEDVIDELAWSPQVQDAHVGVSVLGGVVTLSGEVDTYAERIAAKDAALRVTGVTVVADDLQIRRFAGMELSDTDIGAAIEHVLKWSAELPPGTIQAEVRDRVVVLVGVVTWDYQRAAAERLVRGIAGVLRIDNRITLSKRASATGTSQLIKSALVRQALLDAHAITVVAAGSEVTLTGQVGTWAEKNDAARAAWSSPHVSAVHNKIQVRP